MWLIGLAVIFTLDLLATPLAAEAQSAGKVQRIGYLSLHRAEGDKTWVAAFRQGLRELGYVEDQNVVIEKLVRQASRPTLARLLASARAQFPPRGYPTTRPGTWLKHEIPIRTFPEWDDARPGFCEVDLVAHCGSSTQGFYLCTLCSVDIATTWVELEVVWAKGNGEWAPLSTTSASASRYRAQTPYQRLCAADVLSAEKRHELETLYQRLNPLQLRRDLEAALERLWTLAAPDPLRPREAAEVPAASRTCALGGT